MPYIINLFGEGVRVYLCQVDKAEYKRLKLFKEQNQLNWDSVFFDFDILETLGYKHWTDFAILEMNGLMLTNKNRIEIKKQAKKVLKIQADEVLNEGLLFDLYRTTNKEMTMEKNESIVSFYLTMTEVGLISKYKIETSNFNINSLQFNLRNVQDLNLQFLESVSYDMINLEVVKEDSLVKGMRVEIKTI